MVGENGIEIEAPQKSSWEFSQSEAITFKWRQLERFFHFIVAPEISRAFVSWSVYIVHFKATATFVIHTRNHKKASRTKMYIIHLYVCVYFTKRWKNKHRVQLFVTPWSVAHQAPPSMGFSRQECWSGLPFPSPENLPNPGIQPSSPASQRLKGLLFKKKKSIQWGFWYTCEEWIIICKMIGPDWKGEKRPIGRKEKNVKS